jgi:hypothetical protein
LRISGGKNCANSFKLSRRSLSVNIACDWLQGCSWEVTYILSLESWTCLQKFPPSVSFMGYLAGKQLAAALHLPVALSRKSYKSCAEILDLQITSSKKRHLNFVGMYTGCPRRNVPDFGRVFLMLKYTDITQNTYGQIFFFNFIMSKVERLRR